MPGKRAVLNIKCPYCAETIKAEAIVCRHCNYNLTTGKPDGLSPMSVNGKKVKAESSIGDGVRIGCGMFIVLPILIILGVIALFVVLAGLAK